jgi:hypothetical protein
MTTEGEAAPVQTLAAELLAVWRQLLEFTCNVANHGDTVFLFFSSIKAAPIIPREGDEYWRGNWVS